MKTGVLDLSIQSVWPVVRNMRHQDWVEVSNLVPRQFATVDGITMLTLQQTGVGYVVTLDDVPAAVVQFAQKHDGCWEIGMFATDDYPHVWRAVIKEAREVAVPVLLQHGARYCQAHVMVDNDDAKRLLKWVGFRQTSEVLTNYGAFGKDFELWSITREELNRVLLKPENHTGA